jgi:hypothetical protein
MRRATRRMLATFAVLAVSVVALFGSAGAAQAFSSNGNGGGGSNGGNGTFVVHFFGDCQFHVTPKGDVRIGCD